MSVIAEALLSASLQLLFDKLASLDLRKLPQAGQVHADLKKCEKILERIRAVLNDAEEKQMTKRSVKLWVGELRDLAYDVEDILDELATEVLRRQLIGEQASTSKVWKFIPTCCTSFNPNVVMFNATMVSKIEKITLRLKDIEDQKNKLGLSDNTGGGSNVRRERRLTTSLNEPHVYGRDYDKEAILELLFRNDYTDGRVSVIPIVGMGGIGKTTLAQSVFHDDEVKGHFEHRLWVYVSEDFDIVRITTIILQSLTDKAVEVDDLNLLQVKVSDQLSRRKFMLVLDDVWHATYADWTVLRRPLEAGAPGSKIVVTTRNQGVSLIMGTSLTIPDYQLTELQHDACSSVFTQHALETVDFSAHPHLKEIGDEIVERCKGLPLAAKTLGGLLRNKLDYSEWEKVLKSKIWEIPEEESGLLPALRVSYQFLPPHLKQCFAYCSILPKGYEFEEKEMVLLWMAEGFLEGKTQPEDLGCQYFRELLSRSLFQASSRDESRFVMHDLINDLAQSIAREMCFWLEDDKQLKISKARHYIGGHVDGVKNFEGFYEAQCLRTFLPLMLPQNEGCFLTNDVSFALLLKLKFLRVLSLAGYCITELPYSIGDLIHLRSLDLSHTELRRLPDSVSRLYNLQTLLLRCCSHLEKLPSEMQNLINLHHLDITGENKIREMPQGIGKLICLRTLSNFVVGQGNGTQIRELMKLSSLQGILAVSQLENVVDAKDACEARFHDKPGLKVLEMKWSKDVGDDLRSKSVETDVLNELQPHRELKELTIEFYGGTEFPTWLGDASFKNIVSLNFKHCKNCRSMPPVGKLPKLKYLCIIGMNGVNNIGLEFYGEGCSNPFSSLETLHFEDMQEWKKWNPSEVDDQVERFPRLRELSIKRCPKLSGKLPDHLPSLEKLVIHKCEQLLVVISSLSTLCKLEVEGCKGVECRFVVDDSSLTSIDLSDILILAGPQSWDFKGLTKVEQLKLTGFRGLQFLWQNEVGLLHHFSSLRKLQIRGFPQLVSFGPEEEDEHLQLGLPCSVEFLELADCERLEKLPKALRSLKFLRELCIHECPRLVSFAVSSLPSTLKKLDIRRCENLGCLLEEGETNSITSSPLLEYLRVKACPSLKSLSSSTLPATLRQLKIEECGELESITETFHNNTSLENIGIWSCENLKSLPNGLHHLSHLLQLHMWHCPSLVSFPEGGLPTTNLRVLFIDSCKKLEAQINISSLQELRIYDCPGIIYFPEKGFPTNITTFLTNNPEIIKSLPRFQRLTSLKELTIHGECLDLVTFPVDEVGMMLPTSLTKLTIIGFPNLKHLSSKGFQNLTSLEYLAIHNCPQLRCFPNNGLPPSLLQLSILQCPLLMQCFKRDEGQEWRKIAHIPQVEIDC